MRDAVTRKLDRLAPGPGNPLDPLTPAALRVVADVAILMQEKGTVHVRDLVRQAARSCPDRVLAVGVVEALLEGHLREGPDGVVTAGPDLDLGRLFRPPTSPS